jgi:hypothetical protein
MKYFIDFEFLEGDIPLKIFGLNIPKWLIKPNNTIQPISIGLVSSDGREYYAISKDFNLKEAWNRIQVTTHSNEKPRYWIRENVLKPIFDELLAKQINYNNHRDIHGGVPTNTNFDFGNMKMLLNVYGISNNQIAKEVKEFCKEKPVFYAYYADYDWVVFCWLFGKMNDLPNGFPYYCRDLKQIADNIWETTGKNTRFESPKGEHNAVVDARWNKDFYNFLTELNKQ